MKTIFSIALVLIFQHSAAAQATEVPIKIMKGLPYMDVGLDGKDPYLFGFDTGFGAAMEMDSVLAAGLGVLVSGQTEIGDGSGRNSRILQTGILPRLQIGDRVFENIEVILRNRRSLPGMEKVSGILGMALFTDYSITLDYPALLFRFDKTPLPVADQSTVFHYNPVGGGVPQIDLKVGDIALKAVVDTRSMSGTFKIPEEIIPKLHFLSEPVVVGRGRTVSNEILINQVKISEPIQFGQYVFPEPTVTYPSLNEDVIIGAATLQTFQVSIDQKNQRIQLLQTGKTAPAPAVAPAEAQRYSEYTGTYEGGRELTISEGQLYIQRPGGMLLKMIETAPDVFTLERVPQAVLQFERDAQRKIVALKVLNQQGAWELAKRLT